MQAVPYHQVSSEGHTLEGAISDGKGNLLFCDVTRRVVLRLDADKKTSVLVRFDTVAPGGLALHKDGHQLNIVDAFLSVAQIVNQLGVDFFQLLDIKCVMFA